MGTVRLRDDMPPPINKFFVQEYVGTFINYVESEAMQADGPFTTKILGIGPKALDMALAYITQVYPEFEVKVVFENIIPDMELLRKVWEYTVNEDNDIGNHRVIPWRVEYLRHMMRNQEVIMERSDREYRGTMLTKTLVTARNRGWVPRLLTMGFSWSDIDDPLGAELRLFQRKRKVDETYLKSSLFCIFALIHDLLAEIDTLADDGPRPVPQVPSLKTFSFRVAPSAQLDELEDLGTKKHSKKRKYHKLDVEQANVEEQAKNGKNNTQLDNSDFDWAEDAEDDARKTVSKQRRKEAIDAKRVTRRQAMLERKKEIKEKCDQGLMPTTGQSRVS
ncbi:hypothetical protein FQN54_001167 [Arachnomyces sp. PD_36]|nr:hypothetical protein FQN54_001167 [Arachnomyces sp. PD_36]